MKSFITTLVFFFLFSFIGYGLLTGFFGIIFINKINSNLIYTPSDGRNDLRLNEAGNQKELDILFIGSSHSYRSFDSRNFEKIGWKTFNLGSSAQTHLQTNYLMKKYLEEMNPKLVVYEVYPIIFMNDGIESTINLISSTPTLDDNLLEIVVKSKNVKAFNSLFFSIFLNGTFLKSNFNQSIPRSDKGKYISGGYVQSELSFNEEMELTKYWQPLNSQLKYFNRNVELLKESSIPYILVQTPYTYEFTNEKIIDKYLSSKGIYYNFNTLLNFNNKLDFYDTHHLNQNGVDKLNKEFINIIPRDNLFRKGR